jgi:inhibitor of cysteine peptidase
MKKILAVSLLVVSLFSVVLSGCTAQVKAYTDASQVINTEVSKEFTIAIGSNISTGYSWQPEYDTGVFKLVGQEYKDKDTTGKEIVGAPGTEYFVFKASNSGNFNITFTYYRPWETPTPQDKTVVFNILVK